MLWNTRNKKYIKKLVKMPLVVQINAGSILDNKRKKKTYILIDEIDYEVTQYFKGLSLTLLIQFFDCQHP